MRALLLFWRIFASYGLFWLWARLVGRTRLERYLQRLHRRNAERLLRGFVSLGGVYIKAGQVLSVVGTFLPAAFGELLEQLQDRVPPRPLAEMETRLRAALGPDPLARFHSFDPEPIAAASLAQVHRAVTRDRNLVAVKILYPGIERLITRDLRVLRSLVPVAGRLLGTSQLGRVLDQLEAMLARETDFVRERLNLERVRGLFAGRCEIVIPRVLDELSGPGVLTMSLETGLRITDLEGMRAHGIEPEAVARLVVDAYVTMLFQHRVFHADPHPGNFLVRPGPQLVILDFGAVEEMTDALTDGLKLVVMGAFARNEEVVLEGVQRMGFLPPGGNRALLARLVREYLAALGEIRIADFSRLDLEAVQGLSGYRQIKGRLRELMRNVAYPDGFFYLERTLVLLFGLVGRLAPGLGLPGLVIPYASRALSRRATLG